jgi:hypothetical protein
MCFRDSGYYYWYYFLLFLFLFLFLFLILFLSVVAGCVSLLPTRHRRCPSLWVELAAQPTVVAEFAARGALALKFNFFAAALVIPRLRAVSSIVPAELAVGATTP